MTPATKRVLTYILKYEKKHGHVPSTRIAGEDCGMSQQGIHQHYKRLIKLGLLEKVEVQPSFKLIHTNTLTE
jgi:predicted transcriptional regulator